MTFDTGTIINASVIAVCTAAGFYMILERVEREGKSVTKRTAMQRAVVSAVAGLAWPVALPLAAGFVMFGLVRGVIKRVRK